MEEEKIAISREEIRSLLKIAKIKRGGKKNSENPKSSLSFLPGKRGSTTEHGSTP